MLSAAEAGVISRSAKRTEDINLKLTMERVFILIREESARGRQKTVFIAPLFVMDGCLAEPVLLAKQVAAQLTSLGYAVERKAEMLYINWKKK